MPGMSGIAFHDILVERWPDLAECLIFVTGGVFTPEFEDRLAASPNAVLRKPVEPAEFFAAIDEVVAKRLGIERTSNT